MLQWHHSRIFGFFLFGFFMEHPVAHRHPTSEPKGRMFSSFSARIKRLRKNSSDMKTCIRARVYSCR